MKNDFYRGAAVGCVLALVVIFLGSVMRDSIRLGVLGDCVRNHKTVIYGDEWQCYFTKEVK